MKGEIIPLKYDFVFSQIFNNPDNIEIVEGFISSYFDLPLEKVHNKIKIKSRNLNIEISTDISEGVKDRNVVFLSKVHSKNLEYGMEDYTRIYPSIQINLVSHNINKKDILEKYYLKNEDGKILTKKFRIDYIDMAKAKKICYNVNTKEEKIRKWRLIIMSNKKKNLKGH